MILKIKVIIIRITIIKTMRIRAIIQIKVVNTAILLIFSLEMKKEKQLRLFD